MSSREIRWLIIVLAVASLLRFAALGQESLWYDEAVSLYQASQPAAALLSGQFHDSSNPPLYFVLLRWWLGLLDSRSEAGARSLSAIFGFLTIIAAFVLAKRWAGSEAALLTAGLLAVSPLHIFLSQDARPFALVILLTILSFHFFQKICDKPSALDQVFYILTAAILIWTHYTGFFVLLTHSAFAFSIWRPVRAKLWSLWPFLAIFLLFLPRLPVFLAQRSGYGEVARPLESSFLHFLALPLNFIVGRTLVWRESGVILFALAEILVLIFVAYPVWLGLKSAWRQQRLLLFWLIGIPAAMLAITFVSSPIFIDRYLAFVLPAFLLVLSLGLVKLHNTRKRVFSIALALAGLMIASSLARYYILPQKEDWRSLCAYVKEHRQLSEPVLIYPDYVRIPYEYYSRDSMNVYPLPRAFRDGGPRGVADHRCRTESHRPSLAAIYFACHVSTVG